MPFVRLAAGAPRAAALALRAVPQAAGSSHEHVLWQMFAAVRGETQTAGVNVLPATRFVGTAPPRQGQAALREAEPQLRLINSTAEHGRGPRPGELVKVVQ